MEGIKPNTWYDSSVKLPKDYNGFKDFIIIAFTRDDTVPESEIKFDFRKKIKKGEILVSRAIYSNPETNKWLIESLNFKTNFLIDSISQLGIKIVKWMWADPEIEGDV